VKYVRPIDFETAEITGDKGYAGKILYQCESCVLIATQVPPGARGPENHTHSVDQLYYVIDGETTLKLGSEVCTAPARSAAFIPAGVPHHNWNDAAAHEMHLEILAPGTLGLRQMAESTGSEDARGRPYAVVTPQVEQMLVLDDGMRLTPLVGRQNGSNHAMIYHAELPQGAAGPTLHTHDFDQFYVVLEGLLGVQIGLREYTVEPRHIVILPAGVPHRQWNAGADTEQHLTILTPPPSHPPSEDSPWDISVELRAGAHAAHTTG
jgi:quercetin dioxygenase-like cupin family protein